MMEIIDCKKCNNYFEVRVGYFDKEMVRIDGYCNKGVNLIEISNGGIIECPMYKPKAEWNKVEPIIKEEPKHIKRINKQRKRFDKRNA